jgi:hypothetical protein
MARILPELNVVNAIDGVTMDPYQVNAIKRLTIAGGVFALDMGLGKTITSVNAVIAARAGRAVQQRALLDRDPTQRDGHVVAVRGLCFKKFTSRR